MFHRKSLVAAAVAASLLVTVAGCSAGGSQPDSKSLTYWSMWKKGEPQQEILQKGITAFTKKTGIKVNVQWSGRDVLQQVSARLSAGNPPDLFDQDGSSILSNVGNKNGLLGLDDLYKKKIDGENSTLGDVIPKSISSQYQTKDGQAAILPYEITGSTLWYNGLAEAKVDPTSISTWDGFTADLDKRKAAGDTAISLDGDVPSYEAYWAGWSVLRHGGAGSLLDAAEDKTGETFKKSEYVKAFSDVLQITDGGYLPKDYSGTKFPAQQTAWAEAGKNAGYLLLGTWVPSETGSALTAAGKDVDSTIEYESVPYPTVTNGKGNKVVEASAIGFGISKRARHADAAEKFLQFMYNKDRLSAFSTKAKNLTPRADIEAPAELAGYAEEYRQSGAQYVLYMDGTSLKLPTWETNVWEPSVSDLFNGKYKTGKAVADALAKATADYHRNAG